MWKKGGAEREREGWREMDRRKNRNRNGKRKTVLIAFVILVFHWFRCISLLKFHELSNNFKN